MVLPMYNHSNMTYPYSSKKGISDHTRYTHFFTRILPLLAAHLMNKINIVSLAQ